MRKKKYWKNVFLAFAKSKGRFLSIACLLMIGAMALVGLKATAPNMEQAGQEYVRQSRLADLFVISDYGFSKEDKAELRAVKGAKNEFCRCGDQEQQPGGAPVFHADCQQPGSAGAREKAA